MCLVRGGSVVRHHSNDLLSKAVEFFPLILFDQLPGYFQLVARLQLLIAESTSDLGIEDLSFYSLSRSCKSFKLARRITNMAMLSLSLFRSASV